MLHLPGGAGETGRWCAPLRGAGIPPGPASAGLHLHCAVGARGHPLTRARVRLLGPCFKTGRVGGRPHRGPRPPAVRGPVPARAARRGRRRTEDSPPRSTHAPGAGGPVPLAPGGARRKARRTLPAAPGVIGEVGAGERCKALGAGAPEPPSPPGPSRPNRSRSRSTAAEEVRPTEAERRPGRGPPPIGGGSASTGRADPPAGLNPPGGPCGPHPFTS